MDSLATVFGSLRLSFQAYIVIKLTADMYKQQKGNYSQARVYANRAIEWQPGLTPAYLQRAGLYNLSGLYTKAVDDYSRAVAQSDVLQQEVLIKRGLSRKLAGDFQGALADLNRALDKGDQQAFVYKNRANLHLFFGFTNLAIADYTAAIEKNGYFMEAYYNRGLAHLLRYDPLTACYDLERSAELGFEKAAEMQRFFCIE
jgi:tetratricopeptide (TPR) repeat protein